jgi:hypothetical protein
MMKTRLAVAATAVVLLAACASAPAPSSTQSAVKVVVTTDPAVRNVVDTARITRLTEEALHKYAGHAPAATIAVRFVSQTTAYDLIGAGSLGMGQSSYPPGGHAVPAVSATPWDEPAQPFVSTGSGAGRGTQLPPIGYGRAVVQGTYTITDANGAVLERRPIYVNVSGTGVDDQQWAANYLAKRVAKVTRGTSL